jgi:hypothetical protein
LPLAGIRCHAGLPRPCIRYCTGWQREVVTSSTVYRYACHQPTTQVAPLTLLESELDNENYTGGHEVSIYFKTCAVSTNSVATSARYGGFHEPSAGRWSRFVVPLLSRYSIVCARQQGPLRLLRRLGQPCCAFFAPRTLRPPLTAPAKPARVWCVSEAGWMALRGPHAPS